MVIGLVWSELQQPPEGLLHSSLSHRSSTARKLLDRDCVGCLERYLSGRLGLECQDHHAARDRYRVSALRWFARGRIRLAGSVPLDASVRQSPEQMNECDRIEAISASHNLNMLRVWQI